MTDQQRTEAWNNMPQQMREEIKRLYREYWVTFNARRRMEDIFGRENLNPDITMTTGE